jgi:hypothetical protein
MVFILVLICIRKKLSLGNAFILGAIFLSVLFGFKPLAMLKSMVASIIDPKTLSIAGIVSLILVLSNSMEAAGQMQRLLDSFRGLVSSPRLNLAILPALIGLLPMPGGAAFSANRSKPAIYNAFDVSIYNHCGLAGLSGAKKFRIPRGRQGKRPTRAFEAFP